MHKFGQESNQVIEFCQEGNLGTCDFSSSPNIALSLVNTKQQKSSQMSSTFHPFPRLPLELRLKIWNLTLPPPHLFISLNPWSRIGWALLSKSEIRAKIRERRSQSWSSMNNEPVALKRPVPVVLHVCRESRGEFLGGEGSAGYEAGRRFVSVNLLGDSVFLDGRRDGLFTCATRKCASSL